MSAKRFRIAFSFAGEKRDFVAKIAGILAKHFGEAAILYDKRSLDFEAHAGRSSARTLRFVEQRGLEGATILTAEWPGVVAFYTRNHVVSIDMLTANRKLFDEMVGSGNALRFLVEYCRERGEPIEYFIYNGGWQWLDLHDDPHRVTYFNPKLVPERVRIGELRLGSPEVELTDPPFLVWKLADRTPARF